MVSLSRVLSHENGHLGERIASPAYYKLRETDQESENMVHNTQCNTEFGEGIHPGILPRKAEVGSFILWRHRNVGVLRLGFHRVWSRSLIFYIEGLPVSQRRRLQSGSSVTNPGGFGITLGSSSRLDCKSFQPLEVNRG